MPKTTIRFSTFPRTEPPPVFVNELVNVFRAHERAISTEKLRKGLTSDKVLAVLASDLLVLGFEVEAGKKKDQRIERPVFYGENAIPTVRYEVDAYHPQWKCGLEIEAGRAWMGNAVYRDLIQASVMVEVDYLCLAVANAYKYRASGREAISKDYEHTRDLAEALYGHSRFRLPYRLVVIGY
ncbi:MAG: hypothetical protein ACFFCW_07025 [Candidatus Hodarchaeota archaeon]